MSKSAHLSEAKMRTSSTSIRILADPRMAFQLSMTCAAGTANNRKKVMKRQAST
jgi:hypothetical protein